MKRLEISELMDGYRDNEFFPEEGYAADPEAVKARVLAKVKPTARKKRLSGRKKLLLAAALVLVGAGFPSIMYRLANSTLRFEQTPDSQKIICEGGKSSLELEEGRLFFVLGEERTDITDLIDADTPYIYDGSDPETGMTYYVIMGGVPDSYGYLEWIAVPNPFTSKEGEPALVLDPEGRLTTYHFTIVTYNEQGERYAEGRGGMAALDWSHVKDHPWLVAGAKQLGLPFWDLESGSDEFFYAP